MLFLIQLYFPVDDLQRILVCRVTTTGLGIDDVPIINTFEDGESLRYQVKGMGHQKLIRRDQVIQRIDSA
jgi:hypothetical protein